MGRKRAGKGKHLSLYATGLILLALFGCRTPEKIEIGVREERGAELSLRKGQELFSKGEYEAALDESQKALSLAGNEPPGDEALFTSGLICAHPENPGKDYSKSLTFLNKLMEQFPQSPFFEQAKIWTVMLREHEVLNRTVIELNRAIIKQSSARAEKPKPPEAPPPKPDNDESRELLLRAQKSLAKGDYEGALKENEKVLSISGNKPPGDEALFNMALILAHTGNPKKDYGKSMRILKRIMKEYPQSPRAERAKILAEMLQENEKLAQTVEDLNQMIQKSKQVDIEIEEKRRERTK